MKTVVLTIGPRGAGKTTFCKEVVKTNPEVFYISRDEAFLMVYGRVGFDPYTDDQGSQGYKRMYRELGYCLEKDNATVLLDCWNSSFSERYKIVCKLKEMNVDRIIAWYFVTPKDVCINQFLEREHGNNNTEPRRESTEKNQKRNYDLFHSHEPETEKILFDSVHIINPQQLRLAI